LEGESTWFATGNGTHLGIHTAQVVTEPSTVTVYLEVPDVDATCAALLAAGFEIPSAPVDKPWGGRVAELHDPAGYAIQLVSFRLDSG
jgi:predicted enzyme related to lactoylglutathione lyase